MSSRYPTARSPLLSVLQSAAASVARRRLGADDAPSRHPLALAASTIAGTARPGRTASYAPPHGMPVPAMDCAQLGLELLRATIAGDRDRQQALHDRLDFSQCDPLWAETLLDYARDLGPDFRTRPIPYVRYAGLDDFVLTAPQPRMRIALLSDWGTGTREARRVAALLAQQAPDAVIHLGDIYYAGTAEECQANFLQPLRAVLPDTPLFTLCGNHDVYSGGHGYYGLLGQIGQPASYFCLRSPDRSWQILAADTGLNDRDPFDEATALTALDPAEELWHADKLRGFEGRTVFLTHHQPFSAFAQIGPQDHHDPVNPNLMASHERLSAAGRIDVWFWGHEHRLRLYAPYRGVSVGRNIGYGAVPVEAAPDQDTPLPDLLDPPAVSATVTLDLVDGAYAHGFALLDIDDDGIQASYWAATRPDGPVHVEAIGGVPTV